jgi:glutamyl endopeptidase
MKRIVMLLILLLLIPLFFNEDVLAAESDSYLSPQEIENQTSVTFDGKVETVDDEVVFSTSQEESISPPYKGSGELNVVEEEEIRTDISHHAEIYSIIGPDQRVRVWNTTSFPNRAIVKLRVKYPNESDIYGCTGFMISEDTVATAGHCVYDREKGGWADITAQPGRSGSYVPYGTYDWKTLHSVKGWTQNGNANYDYGAIKLRGTPGTRTGWLGYRWTLDNDSLYRSGQNIAGYPCDKIGSDEMWIDSGRVLKVNSSQLGYDIDTFGCQSGSPVFGNLSSTGETAVAIHAYGASGIPRTNYGTRITKTVFDKFGQWK